MDDPAIIYIDESVEHAHHTVPVQVWIDIDEGIAPLVIALNECRGFRTFASCQGHLTSKVETRADILIGRENDAAPTFAQLAAVLSERAGNAGWELQVWESCETATLLVNQDRIEALAIALANAFPRLAAVYREGSS